MRTSMPRNESLVATATAEDDEAEDEQMTNGPDPFANMPRCGAKTRAGTPCQRIGNSRNGRCILYGGRAGAPSGDRNGRWKHGNATREALAQRRLVQALLREAVYLLRGGK